MFAALVACAFAPPAEPLPSPEAFSPPPYTHRLHGSRAFFMGADPPFPWPSPEPLSEPPPVVWDDDDLYWYGDAE